MAFVAASPSIARIELPQTDSAIQSGSLERVKTLEFAGVFTGRELTRKERRLSSGLTLIDNLLGGGIVRGRISEIVGGTSAGKTSLAACFVASATRRGETAAWIDPLGACDPATIAATGADLARVLWTSLPGGTIAPFMESGTPRPPIDFARKPFVKKLLRATELILEAGGFGLVVIDFATYARGIPQSAALRVARLAERTGAAVIVLADYRMCGTFAALSLALSRNRACFSRPAPGAPALFDGLAIETRVARNKLGGIGARASWNALVDSQEVKPLMNTVEHNWIKEVSPSPSGEGVRG